MFSESYSNDNRIVYMKTLVNLLVHQSRFINLQRYVWDGEAKRLNTVNPLAVVDSVEALSKDSYRLWTEIKRIFPYDA
eukprot:gene2573-3491_t